MGLQALDGTDGCGGRPVFERVFREAGMPEAFQTDNGAPFVAPRGSSLNNFFKNNEMASQIRLSAAC